MSNRFYGLYFTCSATLNCWNVSVQALWSSVCNLFCGSRNTYIFFKPLSHFSIFECPFLPQMHSFAEMVHGALPFLTSTCAKPELEEQNWKGQFQCKGRKWHNIRRSDCRLNLIFKILMVEQEVWWVFKRVSPSYDQWIMFVRSQQVVHETTLNEVFCTVFYLSCGVNRDPVVQHSFESLPQSNWKIFYIGICWIHSVLVIWVYKSQTCAILNLSSSVSLFPVFENMSIWSVRLSYTQLPSPAAAAGFLMP